MSSLGKFVLNILMLILWGFCICIGFWIGHKFTEGLDKAFGSRRALRAGEACLKQAELDIDQMAAVTPSFSEKEFTPVGA